MKKSQFFVRCFLIFLLSVALTYVISIVESLANTSSFKVGFPFKYGSYNLFGEANMNYSLFLVDSIFWFGVLIIGWKLIKKVISKQ